MNKKQSPIQNAVQVTEPFYASVGGVSDLKDINSASDEYGAIQRASADFGQDYSNLTPNLSSRPGLTRRDYEQYRPSERIPVKHHDIIKFAERAYQRVGLIRNIIDLMGDFAGQGIRISCPNKRDEKFYKSWFAKVGGVERSERFLNNLYRTGNIVLRRQTAVLDLKQRSAMFKASASPDIKIKELPTKKAEIPWKYIFLNPCTVDLIGENLACFAGKKAYCLNLPLNFRTKINSGSLSKEEKEIVNSLPRDIREALKAGKHYVLPEDKTLVFHYKKDDWQNWALPMTYAIFDDIMLLEKNKLADSTALDGAISNIRIFRLGHIGTDANNRIMPGKAAAAKLKEALGAHTLGGTIDIVWGPDIDLLESKTEVYKFLGEAKYKPVLDAIYGGIGIPSTLTGTGEGGTTNNFMSLKTLIQRLEYGRGVLLEFWNHEIEIVQKAMGLGPAMIEFDYMDLGDPNSQNNLLIQLADRNLISDELLQHKFGHNPVLEGARIKRENEERASGEKLQKVSPYHPTDHMEMLKRIALQKGYVKPAQVGLSLTEVAKNVKDQTKPELKTSKVPGSPGRPQNSKDSKKRKTKVFTPKSKASLELWANTAQEKIAEIVNPALLTSFGKKNMRSLTSEEAQEAEKVKFGVLFSIEPFSELSKANIVDACGQSAELDGEIYTAYQGLYNTVLQEMGRDLTFDEIRHMQTYLYGEIYHESDD